MEFKNESNNKFTDISSEEVRTYRFVDNGYWTEVVIEKPLKLHVSKAGGHRVFDESGTSHYIPKGWRHLTWKAKKGQPHFVK